MTSKIKVDNINKVSDDSNIINKCGTAINVGAAGNTVTVTGNDIRSDSYKAADGGVIASQSGTTITLGASGDTITLASGASQSGFGRTGTVDWQTSSIKTSTFTAANGEGYFANTSGGAFTMNLPAGTAGNIVSVVDYTNTFQTNALTVAPNGSQKIGGIAASNSLSTEGQSVTFVYVDDTEGWKNVQDSTSNVTGNPFLVATGGTITTSGNCKIHTFTGPGTFTVAAASQTAAENIVSYLIVAGGGSGGGSQGGGGGGGGGFREIKSPLTPYTASPLDGYGTPANQVTVTAQAYPVVVGGGGGNVSSVLGIPAAGGGRGGNGGGPGCSQPGFNGGSGGGGGGRDGKGVGSGNTPPVTPAQGTNGGTSKPEGSPIQDSGGGGGGATSSGANGQNCSSGGGNGGNGATTHISGSPVTYAGGGGGGRESQGGGAAGPGGGGAGGQPGSPNGANGTDNTGGGAGGSSSSSGGTGGSCIVIIRYQYQ